MTDLDDALRRDPKNALARYGRAKAWQQKKEYKKAVADHFVFLGREKQTPLTWGCYLDRGECWLHLGEYQKAADDYTQALRRNPNHSPTLVNRAVSWGLLGNADKAIADYTELNRLEPKDTQAFMQRGNEWFFGKKDFGKAIADYSEVIRLNPKHIGGYLQRSYANFKIKEYAKAIADGEEAIQLDPKAPDGYGQLALMLAACPTANFRDGKRALTLAQKSLELDKNPFDVATLSAAHAEAGNFDQAIRLQEYALKDSTYEKRRGDDGRKRLEVLPKETTVSTRIGDGLSHVSLSLSQ